MPLNKTISQRDLDAPEVAAQTRQLRSFVWKLLFRGDAFAVNGVLKRRFRVRWHKLWEYSRGLAYIPWRREWAVLDFGGGATLPVYYLADKGLRVASYDIDTHLTEAARQMARERGWELEPSTQDLTIEAPGVQRVFDWVMSFCVLEHLPKDKQISVARLLSSLLKPGGYMVLTFDYGESAPVADALRNVEDVGRLLSATGLRPVDGEPFRDTGERFLLDRKYPNARFTFGSLFLVKS